MRKSSSVISLRHQPRFAHAASFLGFSEGVDKIAGARSEAEKVALLSSYLNTLFNDDLAHAALYFSGRVFSLKDQRTTRVRSSAILSAVARNLGASEAGNCEKSEKLSLELRARLEGLGDLGEVAEEAFCKRPRHLPHYYFKENHQGKSEVFSLRSASRLFATLAETNKIEHRILILTDVFERLSATECKVLIKLLLGDLRIGLNESCVEQGIALASDEKLSKVVRAHLLSGDLGEVAVLARAGHLDQIRLRPFHPIKFMLTTCLESLTELGEMEERELAVEEFCDGIRVQVHVSPDNEEEAPHASSLPEGLRLRGTVRDGVRIAIFSKTGDEITLGFPDLLPELMTLVRKGAPSARGGLILDGQIVAVRDDRALPFEELQPRLGRKVCHEELCKMIPVEFVAFDVLYSSQRVLFELPYGTRRSLLESVVPGKGKVRQAHCIRLKSGALLNSHCERVRQKGRQGLVVKGLESPYQPGVRGNNWLKIKL